MKHCKIKIEKDVPAKMRDGVTLYADVYRPDEDGEFPVLLTRLPYSKIFGLHFLRPDVLAENGYIVVVQDVRGRYASEGEFIPYINEANDGYDTVEWAAKLPQANGKVGMFGLSYYGYTQLLAAMAEPPSLKVIVPTMSQNNMTDVFNDHDGTLELGAWASWSIESILPDLITRHITDPKEREAAFEQLANDIDNLEEWYKYKPINAWPPIKNTGAMPYFTEILDYPLDHPHWKNTSVKDNYDKVKTPGLHIGGWYDCFLDKTIANFLGGHRQGLGDKLVIGPWTHGNFISMIGDRDFGTAANAWGEANMHTRHIEWFNHWLKGERLPHTAPIQIFTMGINKWQGAKNWPLENTNFTPLYFHSNGNANTRNGDGTADFKRPKATEPTDNFAYDPENPVPSHGGGALHKAIQADGPRDQCELELREDILCYTSEPLTENIEVTGPVEVVLWAKTDAINTDFTAKLIDVLPDGTAFNLTEGIIRASKQHGDQVQKNMHKYTINLWSTSNVFLKGHAIRVEISSSNFPRFDANPNTGASFIDTTESVIANQTILHDEAHPSHILLPIIHD
ncbi:CocE/NonD family hydrolase [Listeria booriae]|uniref:CocE/NonD family hydrolase n=1 Tax=Listeria booriae TaxID=1552123 RepID=A0A7X1A5Z5_9LIST|nr:CocE/NonD family hydrolase [Listeria booriae]MBC2371663.1 CocE/NonD family hydrolase [Listeria booriae]